MIQLSLPRLKATGVPKQAGANDKTEKARTPEKRAGFF